MRADIDDGPEHNTLQSEAGTLMQDRICQVDETLLQRTAGPYIRVKMRKTQTEHGSSGLSPRADSQPLSPWRFQGDQVMARAVVTPRPPMLRAIRTSSGSLTICRPWSE
jgi:hypothetical protein